MINISETSELEIRNEITLRLYKALKEKKIDDVERIAYEIKMLEFDKDQLWRIYGILKGVE